MPQAVTPAPARRVRSELIMTLGGLVLGILVFGGFLALHAIMMVPYPCSTCLPPSADQAAYTSTIRSLAWIAIAALDAAAGFSVALAFFVGSRSELPDSTRRGVLLFGSVYVAAWLLGSYFLMSILNLTRFYF